MKSNYILEFSIQMDVILIFHQDGLSGIKYHYPFKKAEMFFNNS